MSLNYGLIYKTYIRMKNSENQLELGFYVTLDFRKAGMLLQ